MHGLLLFILLIVIETTSDLSLYYSFQKKYKKYENLLIVFGGLLYILMAVLYYYILKYYNDLAVPNAIYQALIVIAMTFVSYFVIKEKFTIKKSMGILIIFIGLIILYEY